MKPALLALALLALPVVARAAVPSPADSYVDPCLVVCPAGEIPFVIIVRDLNNVPVANALVAIDFCDCPGATLCLLSPTDPYLRDGCVIAGTTDLNGRIEFKIRAGGVCSSENVRVFADGVQLAIRRVSSPDQDGNHFVQINDLDLIQAKVGGGDLTGDLNCDFFVTQADVDLVLAHGGHVCPPPDPTPARRSSWGTLKTIYR